MAFAGVLAFTTVVAGLAAALTLALVLAFACVFALFSISHRLEGDACMAGGARCIGTHGQGPSQEAGNSRPGDYGLGWFNHVLAFVCLLAGGLLREKPANAWFFRFTCAHMVRGNWTSSICRGSERIFTLCQLKRFCLHKESLTV
jgi:hypothetical protein